MATASAEDATTTTSGAQPAAKENTKSIMDSDLVEEGEVSQDIENPDNRDTGDDRDEAATPDKAKEHNGARETSSKEQSTEAPPLPEEDIPPLPAEEPPTAAEADDGWAPIWEETAQAFYFYNRFTGATQWHNPRVPEAPLAPGVDPSTVDVQPAPPTGRPEGGYNPAIHGDYDPNAWYAQPVATEQPPLPTDGPIVDYAATGAFNRFTGRWQAAELTPENFNDENKSKRQMNAFFDVDAAANNHDGRSLKEERSGKKLSKQELKQFKEKRKAKKEEKRRAWLRD